MIYGLPLVVHSSAIAMLFMSDRFFISYFNGEYDVAQYSIAIQLSMIILIFVNAFAGAWGAHVFKYLKDNKNIIKKDLIKKIYIILGFFIVIPFLLLYIQKFILISFFDIKYIDAYNYILVIGIGYAIMGIYKIFIAFLYYNKRTNSISKITIYSTILNFTLNYIFIKNFGSIGVAYSTMISMFVLTLLTYFHVSKLYIFNWRLK